MSKNYGEGGSLHIKSVVADWPIALKCWPAAHLPDAGSESNRGIGAKQDSAIQVIDRSPSRTASAVEKHLASVAARGQTRRRVQSTQKHGGALEAPKRIGRRLNRHGYSRKRRTALQSSVSFFPEARIDLLIGF